MSAGERAGRLGAGVIGDDPVGAVLLKGLAGAGHLAVGAAPESEAAIDRYDAMFPGLPQLSPQQVIERSELVIVAEPADRLPHRVRALADAHAWIAGQLVLHALPQFGTAVLAPALDAGAIPLAVHPAIEITGTSIDVTRMREAWFAVTAPRPVLPIAQALVVELGGEPIVVAEEHRPRYAEAIEVATGFTGSIVRQSTSILREIGVENPGLYLASLVRSAADIALQAADPPDLDLPE